MSTYFTYLPTALCFLDEEGSTHRILVLSLESRPAIASPNIMCISSHSFTWHKQ
jgi:hypothetical protein